MEKQIATKIWLRKKLHNIENYHQYTIDYQGKYRYLDQVEESKVQLAIAMSLEPSEEEINFLESDVTKGTELEVILMELKDITIRYNSVKKGEE